MAEAAPSIDSPSNFIEAESIDLRDPWLAAFLAWLVPGLGHLYQRRRPKAAIFFVCILGTFSWGLWMGEGRVVYASFKKEDRRWAFLCQAGIGLPAVPAMIQAARFSDIETRAQVARRMQAGDSRVSDWFMAPPRVDDPAMVGDDRPDELDLIHKKLRRYFELGTVYTMVAGLLNILAIYDAWGGPAYLVLSPAGRKEDEDEGAANPSRGKNKPREK